MNIKSKNLVVRRCLASLGLAALLSIAGCASDKGLVSEEELVSAEEPVSAPVCQGTSAKAGETVVCSVSNFKEGCLVLLGERRVEAAFDPEAETVEFTIPDDTAEGTVDLTAFCGPEDLGTAAFVIEPTEDPGDWYYYAKPLPLPDPDYIFVNPIYTNPGFFQNP